jgi:hypothetical protein
VLAVLAAAQVGCTHRTTQHVPPPEAVVTAEWEKILVTGSHIPVTVAKSASVRRVPGIAPVVVMTPEDFQRMFGGAAIPMH